MKPDRDAPEACFDVALRSPLVVLAVVTDIGQVDVLRGQLAADYPDERFIGIVAADDGDDVGGLLSHLGPVLAELIFTASTSPRSIPGATLAMRALEELGIGQDFVFTVDRLPDAIQYGIGVLTEDRRDRWEATAILVAGSEQTVREARDAAARIADDEDTPTP
jgi:folylpolyglutamate synthase/dihydropteroate synthase